MEYRSYMHTKAILHNCLICNKEIWVEPNQLRRGEGKFCSRECKWKWQSLYRCKENHPTYNPKIHKVLNCKICNKEFTQRLGTEQTCSRDCGNILAGKSRAGPNHVFWTGGEDRICPTCNTSFHVPNSSFRKTYCSKSCARKSARHSQYQVRAFEIAKSILGDHLVMEKLGIGYYQIISVICILTFMTI
jgi:hypothetical protein